MRPGLVARLLLAAQLASAYVVAPLRSVRRAVPSARSAVAPTMLTEVDKAGWCQHVENSDRLTVVFFYAPWCRNCKAVRPKIERLEREVGDDARFFQANFKRESALCYEERVFTFPTVHFYLPGIGRVSRSVLTARDATEKMRSSLDRYVGGRRQLKLLKQLKLEAVRPVVQYKELVGALQGVAEALSEGALAMDESNFGEGINPKKQSAKLRGMVEGDELRLARLENLFHALDTDDDGTLTLAELEAAVAALRPDGAEAVGSLVGSLERAQQRAQARAQAGAADGGYGSGEGDGGDGGDGGGDGGDGGDGAVGVDRATFLSLMIDKAVQDFAAGEKELLPAFEALDADGDGTITQQQLLTTIEAFCRAVPDADGCDVDHRPLRLAQAFDAFADAETRLLDYERFVEMVAGRKEAPSDECVVDGEDGGEAAEAARAAASASYLDSELENMGERECFGEAVTDEGEDDPGCDAWFFGEDPMEKKVLEVDYERLERLKAAGAAAMARRQGGSPSGSSAMVWDEEKGMWELKLDAALPLKVEQHDDAASQTDA